MTDVGNIKASFIIDDSQYNQASNRAIATSKKVESSFWTMTKSVFSANMAYDLFKKTINFVKNTVQQSIVEFSKQEKAEKMLKTALGFTSTELIKQASAMQKLAGVSDDAVISGQAFLAQMGLTEKQIKDLTPAIVDFAQAKLNGDITGAFNLLSKTVGSTTNALSRYGVEINGAAGSNERVSSAVEALIKRFGGQAEAIRNTMTGSIEALKQSSGELLEVFGEYASQKGRSFIEFINSGTVALTDFLTSGKDLKNLKSQQSELNSLATRLMAVNDNQGLRNSMIKTLNDKYPGFLKNMNTEKMTISDIKDRLREANTEFYRQIQLKTAEKELTKSMQALENITRNVVNQEIKMREKLYTIVNDKTVLQKIENYDMEQQYQILKSLLQQEGLSSEAKWQIRDAISALNDISPTYTTELNKQKKAVEEVTKQDKINEEVMRRLADASNSYIIEKQKEKTALEELRATHNISLAEMEGMYKQYSVNKKIIDGNTKANFEEFNKAILANEKMTLDERFKKYVEWKEKTGELAEETQGFWEKTTENILSKIQYFLDLAKQGFENISQTMMMFLDNDVAAIEASNDEKIAKLEELNEKEQEELQSGYDTKVADLETALENDVITRAEYNRQIEALEAEKNLAEAELQKQQDMRMAKQKADNLKKENAQKKKQFEANKANQIAMLWIQFALGTVAAFAQGIAQLGPIAGAIVGAAMTALLLGTTIAQTVAINNQKFIPERALGGSMEKGKPYVTSERGRELFIPDRSGYMFPNSATETILENVNSRSGKNININMAGAFNGATISDKISLKEIVNSVISELGKQLELKT